MSKNEQVELQKKITYLVFDGNYAGVGESFDPDAKLEQMINFNLDLDILADGYGVTRFETDLLFINNIISRNDDLSWYLLDSEKVELLMNMIVDGDVFDNYIKEQ